jgi:hypothetical protein
MVGIDYKLEYKCLKMVILSVDELVKLRPDFGPEVTPRRYGAGFNWANMATMWGGQVALIANNRVTVAWIDDGYSLPPQFAGSFHFGALEGATAMGTSVGRARSQTIPVGGDNTALLKSSFDPFG